MQWANLGNFSFGNLDAMQQGLYEDNQELGFQKVMNWAGAGRPGFENTVMGRWLASQQNTMGNDFISAQAAQVARNAATTAAGGTNTETPLTWTKWLENYANSGNMQTQYALLPGYMRGSNPGAYKVRRELW